MNQTTTVQMKSLTKIRLINWHYFTDETIHVQGSVLFSGENASGKSTILDAIQLVLTTNTRRFNPAANEKSKRTLQGYVRCKTGDEENTYVRASGPVISYVALEFYEPSQKRYFVIGVKIDSHDVEDEPSKKWFCVDGEMDSLTFIVNGKPALDKDFTQNGKKVQFESQVGRARENFKVRLGRLDDTFGEMILKAMAFKPMDKVKDFINNYILPQNNIKTDNLLENIRNLRDMRKLVVEVKNQISKLSSILEIADSIDEIQYSLTVIDILVCLAALENEKALFEVGEQKKAEKERLLKALQNQENALKDQIRSAEEQLRNLQVAVDQNECGQLIRATQDKLISLERTLRVMKDAEEDYKGQIKCLNDVIQCANLPLVEEMRCLQSSVSTIEDKANCLGKIKARIESEREQNYNNKAKLGDRADRIREARLELAERIDSLRKNKLVYDSNTTELQKAINTEFAKRGIESQAEIFADLLEINPELNDWQDAVEGYLNTQRFNVIVDPKFYDIAAEVYERNRSRIHTVGLVNVRKLMESEQPDTQDHSLYEVIKSENRFARAYAAYLLGRVVRCDSVQELKEHSIAITRQCMKYQGHVLQRIREDIYKVPYIGKHALQIQLKKAEEDYEKLEAENNDIAKQLAFIDDILKRIANFKCDVLEKNLDVFDRLVEIKKQKQDAEKELNDAKNNPSFIELSMKLTAADKARETLDHEKEALAKRISETEYEIRDSVKAQEERSRRITVLEQEKEAKCRDNLKAEQEATEKITDGIKRGKTPGIIAENYGPRRQTLINQLDGAKARLVEAQVRYKDGEYGTGMEVIEIYREDYDKLVKSDLVSYEDKLASIQKDCELEFHENFLAKMRENIEQAKNIIRQLNRSLQGIYYGNDSYKFELTANKERQSLYDMITSEFNVAGVTLFTESFNEQYHNEMEELFTKLTDENLNDAKVTNDLTDYRSYLDYDILVNSRDGKTQRFSKTYGEKSGGETQTPYYVAIAASFAQIYSGRETARLILLDEAFNNMDEDRIESMMKFLTDQQFQIILAAPPARMEIIGEHVNSIFLTLRQGNCSTVEEYFL